MYRCMLLAITIPLLADTPTYQKPPKEILDVLDAPGTPELWVSPSRTHGMLAQAETYPPIAELARPMLRLGGLRIDPRNNGPHLAPHFKSFTLLKLDDASEVKLATPAGAKMGAPRFSPDGLHFSFTNTTAGTVDLWVGDTQTGAVRQMENVRINAVYGDPEQWLGDNRTMLVQLIPAKRGKPPEEPALPPGPHIQESTGRSGPVRTYEDMLANTHDEALFDFYATAQAAFLDTTTGKLTLIGKPAIYDTLDPSPDGNHFLMTTVHRPYSYLHPVYDFPKEVQVWNRQGVVEHKVASLPLADRVPIEGVPVGPRAIRWRPNESATLLWVEALDGGNPKEMVPHRDHVLAWKSPFAGQPVEIFQTEERFAGLQMGTQGGFAIVDDYERNRRWHRTYQIDLDKPGDKGRLIWSRSVQDAYKDPGRPVVRRQPSGEVAIQQIGDEILLLGLGATPTGDRPFLDRFNMTTQKSQRIFQSSESSFETVVALLDDKGDRVVTRRESSTEPPNFFVRDLTSNAPPRALTHFQNPTPQLANIQKQLVTYNRPDGVPLSFTLYLPPGYKPGTALPTVIWAYPREFNDADTAGQITGSTQRFNRFSGPSHLFFLLRGYAILDNASMPVVGTPETVNNTYIEQVVADAKAAIDKAVEMGVTDRNRVGVGGHSYGAFMTANLLAHSDLFKAGIARSGAYNRTLTPFGFQSERRTLWEAPESYMRMSPFMNADKIKTPILLIHGEADNNQGTFPIQSERMYQAIRGNGGTVRYVTLPYESHGYSGRESIEHTLYEMVNWFDRYVKGAAKDTTNE